MISKVRRAFITAGELSRLRDELSTLRELGILCDEAEDASQLDVWSAVIRGLVFDQRTAAVLRAVRVGPCALLSTTVSVSTAVPAENAALRANAAPRSRTAREVCAGLVVGTLPGRIGPHGGRRAHLLDPGDVAFFAFAPGTASVVSLDSGRSILWLRFLTLDSFSPSYPLRPAPFAVVTGPRATGGLKEYGVASAARWAAKGLRVRALRPTDRPAWRQDLSLVERRVFDAGKMSAATTMLNVPATPRVLAQRALSPRELRMLRRIDGRVSVERLVRGPGEDAQPLLRLLNSYDMLKPTV